MSTARLFPAQHHRIGSGFEAEGWREPLALLDPFLMVDHFRMREPVFAPHPHAGFSAVTYLFDDSATGMVSRDSLGGEHAIQPGGLHWTLAGRGVMHDEFPAQAGREAHGLQIFVNLPADQKLRAPEVLKLAPEQMPRYEGAGWRAVQVFGGEAGLRLVSPAALSIVDVDAGARFDTALAVGEQGFAIVVSGHGQAGELPLSPGRALSLTDLAPISLQADEGLRLACFSGRPLREPVVRHGPFAMSDEGQVVAALQRFHSGGMGRLSPRTTNTVPKETQS
ncbi:pirin family protein [Roseateles asaccharophilus]|uniref:Redox-sensitive bicupin YhaK (Pirin superfamily) n=1 Tax=Roseateles asaccharophilus TaxID=582607 RepID=A0ABU2A5K2_9BURK|nr:pirin family protein [Roseateles asaccharophilus]MDR7332474.1 redox-sensitive bicupin YhaK (pirin superfamily) [Roseateles asaccharophilus]